MIATRRTMVVACITMLAGSGVFVAPGVAAVSGTCSSLNSVTAVSATDVWAVGVVCSTSGSAARTLTMHFNGSSWRVVKSANKGGFDNQLYDVVALSHRNAWAVGTYAKNSRGLDGPLIEHFNGTGWHVVTTPPVTSGATTLRSIAAVSARDIWAVGYWRRDNAGGAVALHWDGTAWHRAKAPAGTSYMLHAVTAVSADDVWATGERTTNGHQATLAMHWNGTAWNVVHTPNAGTRKNNFLEGAGTAVSSSDVWVTGSYDAGAANTTRFRTLVLHWNGTRWSIVASPNRGLSDLYGGAASTSTEDVWAVGGGGRNTTLIEHWNGQRWSLTDSPSPGTKVNQLNGVVAVSASHAFAVGYRSGDVDHPHALVLRWDGTAWRVQPSAT